VNGHLEKRSKSSWTVVIELGRDAQGRKRRIRRAVKGPKRLAERVLRELLQELEAGTYVETPKITLADWLRQWLEYHKHSLAPSTVAAYSTIIEKHIAPSIGDIPLASVTPAILESHYAAMLDRGYSTTTVHHNHVVLHKALAKAVRQRLLASNPADAVEPPRPGKWQARALEPEDAMKLLEAIKGDRDYVLIYLALLTGLRRGELCALKWSDVDLERGTITVTRTVLMLRGKHVFGKPKTEAGRRTVCLPPTAVTLLREYRKRQLRSGSTHEEGFVFCNPDGSPLNPSSLSRRFKDLVRRAGLPDLRFHDLRHTHATWLFVQGVHPKVAQERLGHGQISTTMDIYSHVMPGLQKEAAARIEELLGAGKNRWASNGPQLGQKRRSMQATHKAKDLINDGAGGGI